MIVRVNSHDKRYYYDNVVKVVYNSNHKTLLIEFKRLFKNKFTIFNGIEYNDWEVK